jgi:phosphatidylserine decarboxylase
MAKKSSVEIVDRETGAILIEKVSGEFWIKLVYQTFLVKIFPGWFISKLAGLYSDCFLSKSVINSFVQDQNIDLSEFAGSPYKNFNDFFVRKFAPSQRSFCEDNSRLPAFAEGRYQAYVPSKARFHVKGVLMDVHDLMMNDASSIYFTDGPALVCRLCPADYHRFHFPDNGEIVRTWRIHGRYHSVNPLALESRPAIFLENERQVTLLETDHFGLLAFIEVGAACVGKIKQTHSMEGSFKRGDEKGYFLFGASTVIVLGEKGKWAPDDDLLKNTVQGRETLIKLGTPVAVKN